MKVADRERKAIERRPYCERGAEYGIQKKARAAAARGNMSSLVDGDPPPLFYFDEDDDESSDSNDDPEPRPHFELLHISGAAALE
jgi:hypothetical protein